MWKFTAYLSWNIVVFGEYNKQKEYISEWLIETHVVDSDWIVPLRDRPVTYFSARSFI